MRLCHHRRLAHSEDQPRNNRSGFGGFGGFRCGTRIGGKEKKEQNEKCMRSVKRQNI